MIRLPPVHEIKVNSQRAELDTRALIANFSTPEQLETALEALTERREEIEDDVEAMELEYATNSLRDFCSRFTSWKRAPREASLDLNFWVEAPPNAHQGSGGFLERGLSKNSEVIGKGFIVQEIS